MNPHIAPAAVELAVDLPLIGSLLHDCVHTKQVQTSKQYRAARTAGPAGRRAGTAATSTQELTQEGLQPALAVRASGQQAGLVQSRSQSIK